MDVLENQAQAVLIFNPQNQICRAAPAASTEDLGKRADNF